MCLGHENLIFSCPKHTVIFWFIIYIFSPYFDYRKSTNFRSKIIPSKYLHLKKSRWAFFSTFWWCKKNSARWACYYDLEHHRIVYLLNTNYLCIVVSFSEKVLHDVKSALASVQRESEIFCLVEILSRFIIAQFYSNKL